MVDERLDSLERRADDMEAKFKAAFPAGDHEGHRRAHEMQMEMLAERRRLVAAVKEKTIAGLVWATILAIGLACWKYFLTLIGRAG